MGWPHLATEEAMKYWFWMGVPTSSITTEGEERLGRQSKFPPRKARFAPTLVTPLKFRVHL